MSNGPAVDPTTFTYYANHHVLCDGKEYREGDVFTHSSAAMIAELRAAGAISLATERMRPEQIAAEQAQLMADNARLVAELEALKAKGVAADATAPAAEPAGSGKATKSSKASDSGSGGE